MSRLNKKYIHESNRGGMSLKSVAFALLLKTRLNKGGFIRDFSYNKIASIADVSPTTAKKYTKILFDYDIAFIEGKGTFRLRKMHSNSDHRNIKIDRLDLSSFKNAYRSVQATAFLMKQASKDRVKSTTRSLTNPNSIEVLKKARRFCSRAVSASKDAHSFIYREFGLSLAKIAKVCGVCVRTAQRIVEYAISRKWCSKENRCVSHYTPAANFRDMTEFGYNFSTENYSYRILANCYSLSSSMSRDLILHGTL